VQHIVGTVAGMAVVLAQWFIFVEFVEFGWAL
jgi:hypothetical protein